MQMTVFQGASSVNCAVFTQQMSTFLHRFLLPIWSRSPTDTILRT
ncbi:hypothetical protein OKW42_006306 [Paraburkholderia sp. WC7.3d]